MTRLPYLRRDELDLGGQAVWDSIVGSRGATLVNDQGALTGPFNAFVQAPEVGRHLTALGHVLRFETSIERKLSELAIITVGARWKAEFEWWVHACMAREHGVPDAGVNAIGRGEEPPLATGDERAIYTAARQLSGTGRLGEDVYRAVHELLGDAGTRTNCTVAGKSSARGPERRALSGPPQGSPGSDREEGTSRVRRSPGRLDI